MAVADAISTLLAKYELSPYEAVIRRFGKPTLGLMYGNPIAAAPIDVSKVGGDPALPSPDAWPMRGDGCPLDFVGQINFAEAAAVLRLPQFPADGLCLFFYDVVEQPDVNGPLPNETFRALYYPAGTPLVRVPSRNKDRVASWGGRVHRARLNECAVSFRPIVTFPTGRSWTNRLLWRAANFSEEEWTRYDEFVREALEFSMSDADGDHRVGGYSNNVQGDIHSRAESHRRGYRFPLDSDKPEDRPVIDACVKWELLLQLDSDDKGGMEWADWGRLYILVHPDDLAARNFEKAYFVTQGG